MAGFIGPTTCVRFDDNIKQHLPYSSIEEKCLHLTSTCNGLQFALISETGELGGCEGQKVVLQEQRSPSGSESGTM